MTSRVMPDALSRPAELVGGLRYYILSSRRGFRSRSGTSVSRMKWTSFWCNSDATSMLRSMMLVACPGIRAEIVELRDAGERAVE